jgi:hypothetical protein
VGDCDWIGGRGRGERANCDRGEEVSGEREEREKGVFERDKERKEV